MKAQNPFKFLVPYTNSLSDQDKFFGREKEIEQLYELLKQTNLLLLYGFAGVGKTSMVQCGLATRIDEDEWVPVLVQRGENILESTIRQLSAHLKHKETAEQEIISLVEQVFYDHLAPIYLIFDQFEELLIQGSEQEKMEFFQIINALVHSHLRVKVILVFQEEYHAELDNYESILTRLTSFGYRLEPMNIEKIRTVIVNMCQHNNIQITDAVVDDIIQLLNDNENLLHVRLTYLQALLFFLYEAAQEKKEEPIVFSQSLVQIICSFPNLLSRILHRQVYQLGPQSGGREVVWRFLKQFVSIEGSKRTISRRMLWKQMKTYFENKGQLFQCLEAFLGSQLIRQVEGEYYELVHDTVSVEIRKVRIQAPLKHPIIKENPYKGLQPYEFDDKPTFFGRKKVVEELYQKIVVQPLVIIVGDTGSGKSSLVKAGLLPRLKKEGYFIFEIIRPGINALAEIEQKAEEELSATKKSKGGVITIDQYEEIITRVASEEDRSKINNLIIELLEKGTLKIVLTLRIDFEAQVAGKELRPYWKNARYPVPVPTHAEYLEIIQEPAFKAGCYFDPTDLIDEIAQEASTITIVLPRLSFLLRRLYDESPELPKLDQETYQRTGGVVGALSRFADQLYHGLEESDQEAMKKVMLRMVSLKGTEFASKRVLLEELEFSDETENARVHEVTEKLVEPGLIKRGQNQEGYTFIEPAHDALLWGWDKLLLWINQEEKKRILIQDELQVAVNKWEESGRNREYLWHLAPSLSDLEGANWLNKKERQFYRKSRRLKKRNEREKLWIVGLISLVIVLLVIFSFVRQKSIWELKHELQRTELETLSKFNRSSELTSYAMLESDIDRTLALNLVNLAQDSLPETFRNDYNFVSKVRNSLLIDSEVSPFYRQVISGHPKYVTDLAISPDKKQLISACEDGKLRIWLLGDELKADTLEGHPGKVIDVDWLEDNRILSGDEYGNGILWQKNGEVYSAGQNFSHGKKINDIEISPDKSFFATAGLGGTIKIWEPGGALIKEIEPHLGYEITTIIILEDNRHIISGGYDRNIKITNLDTDETIVLAGSLSAGVQNMDYSSSDNLITAGLVNGQVKVWKQRPDLTLEDRITIIAHESLVSDLVFTESGDKIISCSWDKTAKLWDLGGNLIKTFLGHKNGLRAVAISEDKEIVITGGEDKTLKNWSLKSLSERSFGAYGTVSCVSVTSDGEHLLFGSYDNYARVYSLEGEKICEVYHERTIYDLDVTQQGNIFCTVGSGNTARLWDMRGSPVDTFTVKDEVDIRSVSFSSDGQYLLTGGTDGTANLWDLEGNLQESFPAGDIIYEVAFSPDDQYVLVASADGFVHLWRADGTLVRKIKAHTDRVKSVAFSPDKIHFLTGSWDNTLKLWRIGSEVDDPESVFFGHSSDINQVAFSKDGEKILSASADNTVRLWTISGDELPSIIRHTQSITDAAFTPNGEYIVTAGRDDMVKLWALSKINKIIEEIPEPNPQQKEQYKLNGSGSE